MLISAVMPFMFIYRLLHGQYGYKGHVINLPQDITTFVSRLPRLPSQLDILLVRKEGSDNTHCDFRVRKLVVLRALKWLKQHNKFYRNIEINQDALDQLSEDGSLSSLREVEMDADDELELRTTDDPNIQDSATFVPVMVRKMTEEESIRKSVQDRQSAAPKLTTVSWPQVGDSPISEFTTEGYISCAFPTLLPTDEAGFLLTGSTSSSMPSTLVFWEQRTTGFDLSGSTVEVHAFMVLPGFPMPLMWKSCSTLTS